MKPFPRARTLGTLALPVVAALLPMTGCAGVKYRVDDGVTDGIRYYRPATYLLIQPDYEKHTAKATFFHGPDISRAYVVKPFAWLSTNKTNLEFNAGMLSQVSNDSDSTKVPKAVIEAGSTLIQKALEAAAAKATPGVAAKGPESPQVFVFMLTESGVVQILGPKKD